jgi:thymidylate synthase ThyX
VGIYGTGQSYEMLLLRMRAHPLPEARQYAELMLEELRKVIPSFLQRVDRPDRGGAWSTYLDTTREETADLVGTLFPDLVSPGDAPPAGPSGRPSVTLLDFDPEGESKVIAAICAPLTNRPEEEVRRRVDLLGAEERRSLLLAYVGDRQNRRHRPGRAFERTGYRFDVVTDYGAFRDLQRHRMLTIEWQALGAGLGYDVPDVVADAGLEDRYVASLERSRELSEVLAPSFPVQAAYAVALAYRIRYSMQMNAREAMHLVELRSGPQGHPSYRWVAQEMHRLIAEQAGHHLMAEAMSHVDFGSEDLERLHAERRAEGRRNSMSTAGNPAIP